MNATFRVGDSVFHEASETVGRIQEIYAGEESGQALLRLRMPDGSVTVKSATSCLPVGMDEAFQVGSTARFIVGPRHILKATPVLYGRYVALLLNEDAPQCFIACLVTPSTWAAREWSDGYYSRDLDKAMATFAKLLARYGPPVE